LAIIKQGTKNEDTFVVIIGSIDKYDSKNLYSFLDRKNFIRSCLTDEENKKVVLTGLRDSTEEDRASDPVWWYTQVKNILSDYSQGCISLYGSNKDSITEDYLNKLKIHSGIHKEKIVAPILLESVTINATDIREILKKEEKSDEDIKYLTLVLPPEVKKMLMT
jgi:hypothetical protein